MMNFDWLHYIYDYCYYLCGTWKRKEPLKTTQRLSATVCTRKTAKSVRSSNRCLTNSYFFDCQREWERNKSIRADVWIDMCVHICVKLHYSEYLRNQINVRSVSARWILSLIFMGVLQRNAKNDSDFSLFFHIHRKNHCFPRLCVFSFNFFFLSHIFKSSSTVIW